MSPTLFSCLGFMPSFRLTFAGPNWIVDVVDGDFYDVRVVTQTNYLTDNDVVAQQSSSSHYEIRAGGNILGKSCVNP